MAEPERRTYDYDAVLAAPEHLVAELIDGELSLLPRPAPRHAGTTGDLYFDVHGRFGRRGSKDWNILIEPELHLGRTNPTSRAVVPDIAGWRAHRYQDDGKAAITVPPDWVCEVLSPRSARWDRTKKMRVYADAGIPWYWITDPNARILEVFGLRDGIYAQVAAFDEEDPVRAPPFESEEFRLTDWWPPPPAVAESDEEYAG